MLYECPPRVVLESTKRARFRCSLPSKMYETFLKSTDCNRKNAKKGPTSCKAMSTPPRSSKGWRHGSLRGGIKMKRGTLQYVIAMGKGQATYLLEVVAECVLAIRYEEGRSELTSYSHCIVETISESRGEKKQKGETDSCRSMQSGMDQQLSTARMA